MEEKLYQPLLPWLMLSQRFTEHSVRESKGSTNPYINYPDIAKYEFDLPPLDQQRRIADILWATDDIASRYEILSGTCVEAHSSTLYHLSADNAEATVGPLKIFAEFITDGDHNPPPRVPAGIPHLVVKHVDDGKLSCDDCTFISEADFARVKKRYSPKPNDLVLTCVGTSGRVALVPKDLVFSADRSLALIRLRESVLLPEFAKLFLQSDAVQTQMESRAIGTAQKHLYLKDIRHLQVTVPDLPTQREILSRLEPIQRTLLAAQSAILALSGVRSAIINSVLAERANV